MTDLTVWFIARCAICRRAQDVIEIGGASAAYRRILVDPPTRPELEAVMAMLGTTDSRHIARTTKNKWRDAGLDDASDDEVLDALAANPIMIERPIVLRGRHALIARPPERVVEILGGLGRWHAEPEPR